jgi:hypothetical protein
MRASIQPDQTDFIATFSRQRQQLLVRAGQALPVDSESTPGSASARVATTQCLVTALEELKVAEEEMLSQHLDVMTTRAESDRKITYWRTLFDLAPVPLMLTTTDGLIRASNNALATMLTRDVYHLEGKPFVALVSQSMRADFRTQLRRVIDAGGVSAWALTLDRKTRDPIQVEATVVLMPTELTGAKALYWTFREAATRPISE